MGREGCFGNCGNLVHFFRDDRGSDSKYSRVGGFCVLFGCALLCGIDGLSFLVGSFQYVI